MRSKYSFKSSNTIRSSETNRVRYGLTGRVIPRSHLERYVYKLLNGTGSLLLTRY